MYAIAAVRLVHQRYVRYSLGRIGRTALRTLCRALIGRLQPCSDWLIVYAFGLYEFTHIKSSDSVKRIAVVARRTQHDCLMLTAEEKWELYYKKTVALLNDNRLVWDEFIEATKLLKLSCHKYALEHLRHLQRKSEIALYICGNCTATRK